IQTKGDIAGWKKFSNDPGTMHARIGLEGDSHPTIARVTGPKRVDGGWLQRVSGLSRFETYQLSAHVRSSYPLTFEQRAEIGYDPSGQDNDSRASTIVWSAHPKAHGRWEEFVSEPIRPLTNSISVWLRARSSGTE